MEKSCCRKIFEEFFNQFFVKTVERSTNEEETKMTTTVSPIQENISDFQSCSQLNF